MFKVERSNRINAWMTFELASENAKSRQASVNFAPLSVAPHNKQAPIRLLNFGLRAPS